MKDIPAMPRKYMSLLIYMSFDQAIAINSNPTGIRCASKSDPVIHQHSSDEAEDEDASSVNLIDAQPWSCPNEMCW